MIGWERRARLKHYLEQGSRKHSWPVHNVVHPAPREGFGLSTLTVMISLAVAGLTMACVRSFQDYPRT